VWILKIKNQQNLKIGVSRHIWRWSSLSVPLRLAVGGGGGARGIAWGTAVSPDERGLCRRGPSLVPGVGEVVRSRCRGAWGWTPTSPAAGVEARTAASSVCGAAAALARVVEHRAAAWWWRAAAGHRAWGSGDDSGGARRPRWGMAEVAMSSFSSGLDVDGYDNRGIMETPNRLCDGSSYNI
jgi:hypothetical protein